MRYNYYENGYKETFTLPKLWRMWITEIDHDDFTDFESWLNEMIHMQIFNKAA